MSSDAPRVPLNKTLRGFEGIEVVATANSPTSHPEDTHNTDHHHTTEPPPGDAAPVPPAPPALSVGMDASQHSPTPIRRPLGLVDEPNSTGDPTQLPNVSDHPERSGVADRTGAEVEDAAPVHQDNGRNRDLNRRRERKAEAVASGRVNGPGAGSQQPGTPPTH